MFDNSLISDSSSEDDSPLVDFGCVHDDRLTALKADSLYWQLDDVDGSIEIFRRSKYVALHLNIHSIPSKFIELKNMLSKLKDIGIVVHFVLLCETFLKPENEDRYNIPGYSFVSICRSWLSMCYPRLLLSKGKMYVLTLKENLKAYLSKLRLK